MTVCKYYDCGWCYAPDDIETSASSQSACFDYDFCPYLKSQMLQPVQYETPMTDKELVEIEIAYFQEQIKVKQKKLKELEQTKSPAEEAYKKVYGYYPVTDIGDAYWEYFQNGYKQAQKDYKVGEFQEPEKEQVPLYERFENEGAYGFIKSDTALRVVKEFLMDDGVIEDEDEERITFTLQKYLLDTHNDCS